jgi:hypothetical protein
MRSTADVTGGKPIAFLLQSISGVSAINPLVAFYDIHGRKREVLFFYFVPDTTREKRMVLCLFSIPVKEVMEYGVKVEFQVVVPYHYPLECRTDSSEQLLQKIWADAEKRKNAPPKKVYLRYITLLKGC